jgi:hypothetical protein
MLVSNKRWDDAFALHSGGMQESNFSVQLIGANKRKAKLKAKHRRQRARATG